MNTSSETVIKRPRNPTKKGATHQKNSSEFTIFAGGLASSCTSQLLNSYFSQFGRIISSDPQTWSKKSTKCRGFGIISCADRSTFRAILSARKHELLGRVIECKPYFKDKSQLGQYFQDMKQRKIFVRGLSNRITNEDLESHFSRFGELEIAYVVKHKKTGKSKGFGYLCFIERQHTEEVLRIGEFCIKGKMVNCYQYKKSKEEEDQLRGLENKKGYSSGEETKDKEDHSGSTSRKAEIPVPVANHLAQFDVENRNGVNNNNYASELKNEVAIRDSRADFKNTIQDLRKEDTHYVTNGGFVGISKKRRKKKNTRAYSFFGKFKCRKLYRKFNHFSNIEKA